MIKNRIIPLLITVSLLGSCFTVSAAEADYEEDSSVDETIIHQSDVEEQNVHTLELPAIIDPKEASKNGYTERIREDEDNLYTFVFKNSDDTATMRVFSNPVKYVDESNNIRDITLKMKENEDGSFSTADNSIITTFPKSIEDGITLEYEDISLKLTPDSNFLKGSISSNIAEDSDNNNESDVSEIVDSSEEMLSGSTTEEESDT